MDLALELGMTVADLSQQMTERELMQWQRYRMQKMFPVRRMELYSAQLGMIIARTMGNSTNAKLADFILEVDIPDDTPMTDEELAELKAEIGFNPVKH